MKKINKIISMLIMIAMTLSMVACANKKVKAYEVWTLEIFADGEEKTFEETLNETLVGAAITLKYMSREEMKEALKLGEKPSAIIADPLTMEEIGKETELTSFTSSIEKNEADKQAEKKDDEKTSFVLPESLANLSKLGGSESVFYPLVFSPYLMGFNGLILEDLEIASELPISEERKWSFDEYREFLITLKAKLKESEDYSGKVDTGIFYYGASAGDVGTKSFIFNLAGIENYSELNSEKGIEGINKIRNLIKDNRFGSNQISLADDIAKPSLLVNGYSYTSQQALDAFLNGTSAHTLINTPMFEKTLDSEKKDGFETIFMPFPGEESKHQYLTYGIAGIKSEDEAVNANFLELIEIIKNNTAVFAQNSGMLAVAETQAGTLYEGEESEFYDSLINTLGEYHAYGHESEEEKLEWMIIMRKILLDGKDVAEVLDSVSADDDDKEESE